MATIKDVAQAAQVSAAAVSRVLNKDDNISVTPEVRARIFQAAHALGYVSPRQRKAAEHKTHLVIGVADWRDHPSGPAQCATVLPVLPGADDDRPVRGILCPADLR